MRRPPQLSRLTGKWSLAEGRSGGAKWCDDIPRLLATEIPALRALTADGKETLKFTNNDLANPTPAKLWELYEEIVRHLLKGNVSGMDMAPLPTVIDEPEKYSRLIPKASVISFLSALSRDLSGADFTVMDVLVPNAQDTRRFLLNILKLLKFLRPANEVVQRISDEQEQKKAEIRELEERVASLEDSVRKLQAAAEKSKRDCAQLEEELLANTAEAQNLFDICNNLKKLSMEELQPRDDTDTQVYEIDMANEQNRMLDLQLAPSPERLISECNSSETEVRSLRDTLARMRSELADAQEKENDRLAIERLIFRIGDDLNAICSHKAELTAIEEAIGAANAAVDISKQKISKCVDELQKAKDAEEMMVRAFAIDHNTHQLHLNDIRVDIDTANINLKEQTAHNESKQRENAEREQELKKIREGVRATRRALKTSLDDLKGRILSKLYCKHDLENEQKIEEREFTSFVKRMKKGFADSLEQLTESLELPVEGPGLSSESTQSSCSMESLCSEHKISPM